jgi:hypothetical protein
MNGLGHRLSPGPHGDVPIRHTSPYRRGADQRFACAAVAQRAQHGQTMSGVDREPHTPPSGGAARPEAAPQKLPVDDHTPPGTASAVATARAQRLTSCHSPKSPHYSESDRRAEFQLYSRRWGATHNRSMLSG